MVAKRPRIEGITGRFIWKPYKKSRLTKRRGVGKKKKAATRKRKSYIVGSILGGGKRQGPRFPVGGRNALKAATSDVVVDPRLALGDERPALGSWAFEKASKGWNNK